MTHSTSIIIRGQIDAGLLRERLVERHGHYFAGHFVSLATAERIEGLVSTLSRLTSTPKHILRTEIRRDWETLS